MQEQPAHSGDASHAAGPGSKGPVSKRPVSKRPVSKRPSTTDLEALRRPLHLLLWGMIFGTIRIGPFPELFFDLTAAALTGFAAIGLLQATQNRIARAGLTFVAMITLFEAISALLPPSGHPWIAVIRIMPSLYLPAIVAHAMVAIADQLEWGNVHRSWIRTFQLAGFLALAGSAFVIWRAVEGRVVADSFSPHSGAEYTAVILAVGFGLWMIVQYLSSIVRSLNQVRTDLDAEKLALSTPE